MTVNNQPKNVKSSIQEYSRGIAGGLLFSFPLLYTMEVWWAGFILPPHSLLILIGVTFLLLLGYNRFAGMRPNSTWWEVAIDSVEEMGLGFTLSIGILFMLNRIQFGMAIEEVMGKVVIEAMAVSIGVSVGTAQLGAIDEDDDGENNEGGVEDDDVDDLDKDDDKNRVALVVLAVCGGIIVGSNVAPTEEILMIATEAEPAHILAMALFSLILSVVIVYFSNFKGSKPFRPDSMTFELLFDTAVCYLIALSVSAFLLWYFDRFVNVSFWIGFSQCIVLTVLTSLGSSAGRLLIK